MKTVGSTNLVDNKPVFTQSFLILFVITLALLALVYAGVIYLSSAGESWWMLDLVNNFRIWGVDDSYRFYLIGDAFNHISYYSWSYTLPFQLLVDGGLSFLFNHNIVFLRAIHGAFYLVSLFFLTRSIIKLTHNWPLALSALLLLGLIPFCLFVSLSFYAESYMMVFVVLMLVARINRHDNLLLLLAALSPLIRPEGVFFLGGVGLYFLFKRDIKRAVLAGLPVGLFFVWMLMTSGWSQFYNWRVNFLKVQIVTNEAMPELQNVKNIWRMFGVLFSFPAILSLIDKRVYVLWPLLLATAIWFAFWVSNVGSGKGNYEARYFAPLVPVLVVMWALGVDRLYTFLSRRLGRFFLVSGGVFLFIVTLSSFLLQQSYIKFYVDSFFDEDPMPFSSIWEMPLRTNPDLAESRQDLMKAIYHAVSIDNPYQVDRLLFSTSYANLYYYLDPQKVPANVMVGFVPTRNHDLIYKEPKNVFAMLGSDERYAYFDFSTAELGSSLAVFVGNIEYIAPTRIYGDTPLYLFSYQSRQ